MDLTNRISGYHLGEQLYCGSRTLVYRAIRETDQLPVVIKLLNRDYPSFSELLQFRNQYTIAKNLRLPGVVEPYNLESYRHSYALVMEDFGGISLRDYAQEASLTLAEILEIGIQITDILHGLYRYRVIHKDIKPANVLIHPETKQVKLIDFSIASLLPRETQEIQHPDVLEGTLAYISPEQTGRMNRGIDYRTDFYSLGATFCELLTGKLPFECDDPMELVHCHIAKQPPSIKTQEIPQVVSDIVMKLMAKNAEKRYQSALGLKHDLERCLQQCQETGKIETFELGTRDICDRFLIPEKLYGREIEVQTLLSAFDRVANGTSELMLVAGFSGIGKTAVVNEVHKPIVRQRGYFIKGKFDQFNRNIPFSAFVQAFRDFMAQLLSESDAKIQGWKTQILEALGDSGQVIMEVIPELERIIGSQPPAPELSGMAAQNLFNLLFHKFIAVFTTKEHPLVIFLDDLQWADSASLKLMQLLVNESQLGYLLLLGAYRDNEVSPGHPLMLILDEVRKAGTTLKTITLAPLGQISLNQLVADTLVCNPNFAQPLTELAYQKTKGNPFFATQFLKALHQDELITFEIQSGHWQCDISKVREAALTDDVVVFMAQQLQKMPATTQSVLKLAACIGNQFDLATLAIVSESSETETATALWKALQEELIIPQSEVYKFYVGAEQAISETTTQTVAYRFLHDRVQQAAYSLIPQDRKQATHLKIGQLLLHNTSSEAIEASIFEIVNQLNEGISPIVEHSEKFEIAQLNLIAGRKAKAATAYKAAVKYFALGIELLPENSWHNHYNLTFGLYRERAECEYLTGNLHEAENLFDLTLNQARDKFELADIYAVQMYLKMTQGENIQAGFEAGLKALSIMGMNLPLTDEEQQAAIKTALEELNIKLETVCPADLFDLPEMTDPVKKVCMSLLADLWAAAYMAGHQYLSYLSLLLMINTSLKYGNADGSGFAYCLYGMSLANQGDYQTAYEFGKLALKLDRHLKSTNFIYKTNNIFAHTINPYNQHLKTNLPLSRQSFQTSGEAGDIVFGVWAVSFLIWAMLVKGDRLADVYEETEKYLSYVQQVNDVNMLYAFTLQRQFLLSLQDLSQNTDLLDEPNDRDTPYIEVWRQKKNFEHGINWYCFLKLKLSYFYGRYADAVKAAEEAKKTLAANGGFFPIIQYYFYYPLSLAALYSTATSEEKQQYWNVLEQHQQIVKNWADNCPANFLHRYLLLSAEMAQLSGRCMEATDYYDRAIAQAKENDYIHEEALANELAAKFYLNWGKKRIAGEYMIEAYYAYARWGAKAKVADLERRYPQLLAPILEQIPSPLSARETIFTLGTVTSTCSATSSSSNVSVALDLATILKAYQTLSGEIELEKLLKALLHLVIENAGADKCVFMLLESDRLLIQASAQLSQSAINFYPMLLNPEPVEDSVDVPIGLINSVKRSLQPAVIIDGRVDPQLINDLYIQQQQPKSILCCPILHQGKLLGILYLENNLATGAFTSDRVELLNLLCAQAAISLENARLYRNSQNYAQQLTQSLAKLQASETRFQNLANNIPGMVYQFRLAADGSTSTPYVSSGCLDLYGLEPESVMAGIHSLYALHHPEDDPAIAQAVAYSAQTLTPFEQEWRIILPSGTVKWIYSVARPERQADGATVWDGVVIDTSDRQRAEKQLQESQQLLELVLNTIPHKVFWKDCNLIYQGSNRAFAEVVGFSSSTEIVGKSDYELSWTTEESDWFRQCDRRVIESNLPELGIVETTLQADGTTVWIETSKLPLHDATGTVIGVLGIYQDISDRKQAEIALQEKEQFLSSIYDGAEIVIFVLDVLEDGSFRYAGWNAASERASGISVADIVGKTPTEVFGAVKGKNIQQRFAECASTGMSFYSEDCLTFGGQETWWFATINPIKNAEGRVYRIIGTMFDISDRKRAELAVQQKSEELEQALHNLQNAQLQIVQSEKMSALGNLVAGVAHEMNNPLGFILASLKQTKPNIAELTEHLKLYQETFPNPGEEIIDHAGEIDLDYTLEDLPKALDAMEIACDRLRSISTSLRTFSRADREYKVPFNIHEGIDSTILILKHRLKANHQRPAIEVITEYGHLPQIDCFPGQLNQVFMNIIANAIDSLDESNIGRTFAQIKAKPNRIKIATSIKNQEVKIAIADNGQGMSESVKQKIFEHLFTTKAVGKGTGLGLAIARQIVVEKHKGTISVNSEQGVGTEFVITLFVKDLNSFKA